MGVQLRAVRSAQSVSRVVALVAALMLGSTFLAAPAFAAAPANDDPSGAVALSLGDHITLDTTEATTDAFDASVNEFCGAPETKASVWYTYTPAEDGGVVLDMSASSYSGGFLVFEGAPSADSLVTCGPGTVGFGVTAGVTYTIMVVDDDGDGDTASGGTLVLDVNEAPPPPTTSLTVDKKAKVTKDGKTVLLTGSYTCTDADFIEVDASVTQSVGRFAIQGYGYLFDEGTCDGTAHSFTMPVTTDLGRFAGGKSATVTYTFACGPFDCADSYQEFTVRLTKGRV